MYFCFLFSLQVQKSEFIAIPAALAISKYSSPCYVLIFVFGKRESISSPVHLPILNIYKRKKRRNQIFVASVYKERIYLSTSVMEFNLILAYLANLNQEEHAQEEDKLSITAVISVQKSHCSHANKSIHVQIRIRIRRSAAANRARQPHEGPGAGLPPIRRAVAAVGPSPCPPPSVPFPFLGRHTNLHSDCVSKQRNKKERNPTTAIAAPRRRRVLPPTPRASHGDPWAHSHPTRQGNPRTQLTDCLPRRRAGPAVADPTGDCGL